MAYQLLDDDGRLLDALFDLQGANVILHSRGGAKGRDARNPDYALALRVLIDRIRKASHELTGAWVDTALVRHLPLEQRRIASEGEGKLPIADLMTLLGNRMKNFGAAEGQVGGNPTKRLMLQFSLPLTDAFVTEQLGAVPSDATIPDSKRLPVEMLEKVTAEHVWNAVEAFKDGTAYHHFSDSRDFDLIDDEGGRHPPKAVFGVALEAALGLMVKPFHFTAGIGTPCFRILEASGFSIVPKNTIVGDDHSYGDDDREWDEGGRILRTHEEAERKKAPSKAKKAEFKRIHGRLFCERCRFEPAEKYDHNVSNACIEVHHRAVQVADMKPGHKTRLEDLMCLCANCHRVTHEELRLAAKASRSLAGKPGDHREGDHGEP